MILIGVAFAQSQEYKFPGKYLFCAKERCGLANIREMWQFQEKVAEIIINKRLLEIHRPKEISDNQPIAFEQLGAGKFSEATHSIFYGLKIDYRPNKNSVEFFVSGFLSIEKLENGVASGKVWKRVDGMVQSSGYDLGKIESQEEEYPRQFCVGKLAEILAEQMIDKIVANIKQMKEFYPEDSPPSRLALDKKTRGILEREVARLNQDQARKQRLQLLRNFAVEVLSFTRTSDHYWLARYRIINRNSIALKELVGQIILVNADRQPIAKIYQAFHQEFPPNTAIVQEKRWPCYKYPTAHHLDIKLVAFLAELKINKQKQSTPRPW